tara:strand:+ start:656 stop:820 length:165 start_codon:yes stop_codon:yes gene_type:complete
MAKEIKHITIEEIREHIESKIKTVDDVTASRIYEKMTGHLATWKSKEGTIRLIT